jgi:hypothetical protein
MMVNGRWIFPFKSSRDMKLIALLIYLQLLVSAGFSQTLPTPASFLQIRYHATNFDITWDAPDHSWADKVWVYRDTAAKLSDDIVSNILEIGSFTQRDKKDYGIYGFTAYDSGRVLRFATMTGKIYYYAPQQYGIDHLVTNLPSTNAAIVLTKQILPRIGIGLTNVEHSTNGELLFHYDPNPQGTIYYTTNLPIVNLNQRTVGFKKALDGLTVEGGGGIGTIDYGENGRVIQMDIDWRGAVKDKEYDTATKDDILKWLKDGHCYFPRSIFPPHNEKIDIDWTKAKHLTINRVQICYWGIDFPDINPPSKSTVYPYAILHSTVDTGQTNLDITIDCPIIDFKK